jgi:hypothetical protein
MSATGADFPYRLRVTRANSTLGTFNTETGELTAGGADQVLYDGRADVQDAGESVPRNTSGMPFLEADATVFLKDEKAGLAIEPNDVAVVYYPDSDRTAEGEVKFVRELDGAVLLKYR